MCKERSVLEARVKQLAQREVYEALRIAPLELRIALAQAWREKILELIYTKGDVADRSYLYLYGLFEGLELELEARFDPYITLAESCLKGENLSTIERILFLELRALARLLKGEPKVALEEYLRDMVRLNVHEATNVGMAEFIREWAKFLGLPEALFFEALRKNLALEYYLTLPPLERRSIFNWSLHVFWNISHLHNTPHWMELYPLWRAILAAHLERGELAEAMYLQFYIYHKMGNHYTNQEDWRGFNTEITKLTEPYYKAYAASLPPCKPSVRESGKKVIGFLRDRAVENSPYKVEWSLLKALMQNEEFAARYEIKVYLMGYVEKSDDDPRTIQSYRDIGVEFVDVVSPLIRREGFYHSHLQKALALRERILSDGVDILISPNNGYDISDFLLISRSAPRQIFWSHGNYVYDVEGIDKRISHCANDGYGFSFEPFVVPMDMERFYNPPVPREVIEAERAKYPAGAFILGVIGRLVKVDSDEYLETIATIMKQNPKTIFIAAGMGNHERIRAKVEKLGISERFYMPGWVNPHLYGHIIDLWCDTFPLEQGESTNEFYAKGGAGVTMCYPSAYVRNERVEDIKLARDKMLFYIKNYREFREEVEGYAQILEDERVFLVAREKDRKLVDSALLGKIFFVDVCENEVLKFADFIFEVQNGTLRFAGGNPKTLKPIYSWLRYWTDPDSEISQIYQNDLQYDGFFILNFCMAYNIENYIEFVSKQVLDNAFFQKVKQASRIHVGETVKHKQKIAVKDFLSFLSEA